MAGGGIGGAIGSAVGSLGGVGKVLGPAIQLGSGANPLGVFGASLASEALGGAMGGGGGGSNPAPGQNNMQNVYAQPDYNYGANTYTMGKNPIDASKYFITGDKGVYNLMPMLAPLYGDKTTAALPGTSSYNVYQSIYDKMAGDAKAQQALAAAYGPKQFSPSWMSMFGPMKKKTLSQLPSYLSSDVGSEYGINPRAPIQYVDWGFGPGANSAKAPWEALANYAGKQNNPFFVPYAPTGTTTPTTPALTTPAPTTPAPTTPTLSTPAFMTPNQPTTMPRPSPMQGGLFGMFNRMKR